jgi:cytochrome c-type biogenesis protein CcmF
MLAVIVVLAIASPKSLAGAGACAMAGWLLGTSIIEIRRRRGARLSAFAAAIAHAGLAVSLLGIAGTTVWRSEALVVVGPGETLTVGPYTLRFDGVTQVDGPNYKGRRATIDMLDGAAVKATMHTELRVYDAEGQDISVTAIRTTGLRDLYLALGDDRGQGRWTLRAYVSPLAPLIWLGALVMALGGALSLAGRLRARAPEPKSAPSIALAAE